MVDIRRSRNENRLQSWPTNIPSGDDIRRVKGVRRLGVRLGNWLTPAQGRRLLDYERPPSLRGVRDRAMLAMLIGCGQRRGELLWLTLESLQRRELGHVSVQTTERYLGCKQKLLEAANDTLGIEPERAA